MLVLINLGGNQQGGASYADRQVKIYDQSTHGGALRKAAKQWNQSGLNLKISFVQDRKEADVIALSVKSFNRKGCMGPQIMGCASIDRRPWPYKGKLELRDANGRDRNNPKFVDIASHEIGHLLGLRHNDRVCALMNNSSSCREARRDTKLDPTCPVINSLLSAADWCPSSHRERVMCGPSRAELGQLIHVYGGAIKEGYSPWCRSSKKQSWRGWCIYPQWTPRGEHTPGFIEGKGKSAHCSPRKTPTVYKSALRDAILELREVREEAEHPRGSGFSLSPTYQAYQEKQTEATKQQANREIARLQSSLERLTKRPASG